MSKYLMVDIGAGTLDVLYYDADSGLHYKAVARSPVLCLAERAAALQGNLLVVGNEMGGGPMTEILRRRAREASVVMTAPAALTLHHDLEKVRQWGIRVIADDAAEALRSDAGYNVLSVGDLEVERLRHLVEGFGVPFRFDVVAVCAQDHGMPPPGVSHLDHRHHIFRERLDANPFPDSLLFREEEIPATFNRLCSIAETARTLPAAEIYLMDSGMAAILGASMDFPTRQRERIIVLDVATSHTVGAALETGELAGFFEYHTRDITLERLESLLQQLAAGNLEHRKILEEGGHGAYVRKAVGFAAMQGIVATGPRRSLVEGSRLSIRFGAPWGDNMMTGTVGLLEAVRRRKGMERISYL